MKTKAIFRKFAPTLGGDIIALFPEIPADRNGNIQSYQHNGQHGAASPDLGRGLHPATPEEYAPLKLELEALGYDLDVKTRSCPAYAAARRKAL